MNRTFIIGHVTKDAQTRTVKVGGIDTLVTDFTVAANEGYGENQKTEYFRITVWRERGAKMAPHLVKGRAVSVMGIVSARGWKDNEGNARAQLEMSNPTVEFIGKKPGDPEDLPFAAEEAVEA
jgi:single stranded DNA-binding protein